MSSALEINKKISQDGSTVYAASSAGSDAYAITLVPAIAAYTTGQIVQFEADVANTGAATLNINGIGAITIKKNYDQDLANNDIEAGQIVTVVYDGTNFQMQSQLGNASISTSDFELITSITAANNATIDFTGLSTTYIAYTLLCVNLIPATDGAELNLQVSDDNGATFKNSGYAFTNIAQSATTVLSSSSTSATLIPITDSGGIGNGALESGNANILIYNPGTAAQPYIDFSSVYETTAGATQFTKGMGLYGAAITVNAVRLSMSAGNITSGEFKLYGLRTS